MEFSLDRGGGQVRVGARTIGQTTICLYYIWSRANESCRSRVWPQTRDGRYMLVFVRPRSKTPGPWPHSLLGCLPTRGGRSEEPVCRRCPDLYPFANSPAAAPVLGICKLQDSTDHDIISSSGPQAPALTEIKSHQVKT